MRGWIIVGLSGSLIVVAAAVAFRCSDRGRESAAADKKPDAVEAAPASPSGAGRPADKPPPGLPISSSLPRDYFHVLDHPSYVAADEGDHLLLGDEPVLGIVLGGQARAYSTNQLNRHEMVLDEIAGTAVLVTY